MAILEKSQLTGRVTAMLSSPVRETGLEKSRADRLDLAFAKLARNKRGLVAWVKREDLISVGDEIMLHIPPQRIYAHA